MSSCIIQLDNFPGQYYPGGNVIGRVVCSFTEKKNIREIRLKLRGTEHTNWTGTQSYYDNERKENRTRTVEYIGHRKFWTVDTSLRGSGDVGPGRMEFPFNFILPKNLPGSFHGKYGWIKFTIKATVDRPYKTDYEDVKEFTVVSPIDFNEIKNELDLDPVSYSDDKTLCCCCCADGPITMNVNLEKEAFIQGETAKVRLDITNMSNVNVERVGVKMGMTVESRVTNPTSDSKSDYELLATANDTGVGAHGERSYNFTLEIPRSTVVPNFNLCTLFKQWTKLTVTAALPSCHTDMEITTRVVLGHIPVGSREPYQNATLQQSGFYPPQQTIQYPPGAGSYPAAAIPYPSADPYKPSYPSGNNFAPFPPVHSPYPPGTQPPPYAPPPNNSSMGFTVPTGSEFPNLPSGGVAPGPSGPSAPPIEDKSSAPSKAELAAGGGDASEQFPPPSYNEAVPFPPYPPK